MSIRSGRHFLQVPGPSNVPERILRAIDRATMDHRGPEFSDLTLELLDGLKKVFKTEGPVIIFPSSGTGAWEAALVNTLSPGDRVMMFETGHFATLWCELAGKLGLEVDLVPGDWRHGVQADDLAVRLDNDKKHEIKAICAVHNETSTGVASNIAAVRKTIDDAGHPALLMVDTISSLASIDYRHDEWCVDVTIGCSQKGLMLPPGLGLNAVSQRALDATKSSGLKRSYWDWDGMLSNNASGFFPYTPSTNLLYGLQEALNLLFEEGLDNVFVRHDRHAEATRRAVQAATMLALARGPANDATDDTDKDQGKEEGEEEVSMADLVREWAPLGFVYLLWVALMTIAQMLLNNTIEEKSNRIIEVLLSSVTTTELMAGKLMGIAGVGLTMLFAWVLSLVGVLSFMAGPEAEWAGHLLDILASSGFLTYFLLYFLLGYLLYAGVFLAIGSVCNTLKEAQNFMSPLMLLMMVYYYSYYLYRFFARATPFLVVSA